MDIIEKLQAYKDELTQLPQNKDYHIGSKISLMLDKIDALIVDIIALSNEI